MRMLYREFTDQAQIDAQYNAGLRVADPAVELAHYRALALRARESLPCHLNVPYGPTRAETLDIFPAAQPSAPVFVFIHGGYWRALSSKDFSGVALGLQALGVTSVIVDYALCPQVSLDEIVRQARSALAWVLRHIAQWGGDPARVAIGGHSAGAHLSAMALQTPWARDYGLEPVAPGRSADDPFKAALLVSGIYDIAPLRYSYLQPQIQLDDGLIARNSPRFGIRPCSTPVLTTWGQDESSEFARQAQSFHEAWLAAGNPSVLQALPGAHHFSAIHGFDAPSGALAQWVAQQLGALAPL